MYKRILVPIDGSSTADRALHTALQLAKETRATLRIVHIVEEINLSMEWGGVAPPEWEDAIRKSGQTLLENARTLARSEGVEAQTALLESRALGHRVPEIIANEAGSWPADVIVIGTHGRRGLHHMLLGSVAEGVARVATVPVLMIRGK